MADGRLPRFEQLVRRAYLFSDKDVSAATGAHPFEQRGLFSGFPTDVRDLFDNGHYAQATFEAFKFVDREVARLAGVSESGKKLMMQVFAESKPAIQLTPLATESERSEQEGYKFLFAGSILAIRNPRGHEYSVTDTLDECLDYLSFASMLLRRLQAAGYNVRSA